MHNIIHYEEIESAERVLFVDLRTTREYEYAHIPGALSLPVLSDEEHVHVSTEYMQGDKDNAKILGVRYTSQRLPMLFTAATHWVKRYDKVVVYCYRGGYRSSVLFQLLLSLGIGVYKLSGGYKAYRKYVNEHWADALSEKQWVTLYGNTGTGKTEILHALREKGAQVVDLEALANHRGSLLGGIGLTSQPSQKMFESLLQQELLALSPGPVFLEGESRKIGDLFIPQPLFEVLTGAPSVHIDAPLEDRIHRLKEEYTQVSDSEIRHALQRMIPYIGNAPYEEISALIASGDTESAIERLLLRYYDIKYNYRSKSYAYELAHHDTEQAAEQLMQALPQLLMAKETPSS